MKPVKLTTLPYLPACNFPLTCCPKSKKGQEVIYPESISTHRVSSTSYKSSIKISYIACVLDRILSGGSTIIPNGTPISCATYDDGVFMECDGQSGYTKGADKIFATTIDASFLCTLEFVHAIRHSSNSELRKALSDSIKSYNATGYVPQELVALVCDSFYYGNAKKTAEISVEYEITKEEIEARMRQESLREIKELKDTNVTKPVALFVEKAVSKKARPKEDLHELLKACKNGDYLIDYKWDESQEEYRQSLDSLSGFIPSEEFRMILNKIKFRTDKILSRIKDLDLSKGQDRVAAIGSDYINLTLCGKPGTGKTKLAYEIGAATGMPVYTIACSHNTDEDEFAGMTKMIDGTPQSVATDTLKCVENGGILLLEEANLPQAAVMMGALGQLVEFPFILKKFGYEPIRRHPLCVIIVTMNTGTAGSKLMSQPFSNRLKQSFCLNDPKKEDFIRILMSNTNEERVVCRWVYDCYERIVACVENENGIADSESILLSLSMRTCIGAIENIQEGMEAREAIKNSIIGKIAEQDIDVAKSCEKTLASMRNPDFD